MRWSFFILIKLHALINNKQVEEPPIIGVSGAFHPPLSCIQDQLYKCLCTYQKI